MGTIELMTFVQRYEVGLDTRLELVPQTRPELVAPVAIWFEGRKFTWYPGTNEYFPVLAVDVEDNMDAFAEEEAVERLLSALSFHTRVPIRSVWGSVAGREDSDPPSRFPRSLAVRIRLEPEIVLNRDPKLRTCLALMREAMTSVSVPMQVLGYWKVIELVVGQPNVAAWLNQERDRLRGLQGNDYRADLGDDWYIHLNEARVAAAHAVPHKIGALQIDPDDPRLEHRLQSDIGILSLLARAAIEREWPDAVQETYPPDDMLGRGSEWEALMNRRRT